MKKLTLISGKKRRLRQLDKLDQIRENSFKSNKEVRSCITKWLQTYGWNLNDFVSILKDLGIYEKMESIELKNSSSFIINCEGNSIINILLESEDLYPIITINTLAFSQTYSVGYNYKNKPLLTLIKKTIYNGLDKKLYCRYSKNIYVYSLITSDYSFDIETSRTLSEETESYLLSLKPDDYVFDLSNVCFNIQQMNKPIYSNTIYISCQKIIPNDVSKLTSRIHFEAHQGIIEYTISKIDGVLLTVFSGGNWKWVSADGLIQMTYNSKDKSYNYNFTGTQRDVFLLETPSSVLSQIKDDISHMQQIFRKNFF